MKRAGWRLGVPSIAMALAVVTGLLASPGAEPVRVELGSYDGAWIREGWQRAERASLRPEEARDASLGFYYRSAGVNSRLVLPLATPGAPLELALRARVPVRSRLTVTCSGRLAAQRLLPLAPWDRYELSLPARRCSGATLELAFALEPQPLVRGDRAETPTLELDYVELATPGGLALTPRARLLVAVLPLLAVGFAGLVGFGPASALFGAAISALAGLALLRLEPLGVIAALPRLLPVALGCGLLTWLWLRWTPATPRERSWLSALVAAGILFHGALVFFPDHNPPDMDIHVRRTTDLADVPLEYGALLRYGSQLPTASQDRGAATAALGEQVLLPYSPLPYLLYRAAQRFGLDLYWALTVLNAALAMLVAPWLWVVMRRLWGVEPAWLGALLYSLDLAVWHHVGRSHAPAVLGGALGTAALLYLAHEVERVRTDAPRRVLGAGLVLACGVLGYSSLAVLYGLFGLALLALLSLDARALGSRGRAGLAAALVAGGLVAGALYYFHYLPGLLRGASSVEAAPDLFPGRTFVVFHNESRQSYRLWVLGYWIPLLAGLAAAPRALRSARPSARPILAAWLAAWGLVMLLKEPWLFPRLLRWAKEDQFLSPLLCLLIGGAVGTLTRTWLRRAGWALALGLALWLQLRDYRHHASSLLL